MLALFDDVAACESVFGLFTDVTVSLFRQWVLRPEFRHIQPDEPVPVTSGDAPLLASLDSYTPRPATILVGASLRYACSLRSSCVSNSCSVTSIVVP
jgi:hypothetical protein